MGAPDKPPVRVGVAHRTELAGWIETCPPGLGCREVSVEQILAGGGRRIADSTPALPFILHASSLSLGTRGPLDPRALARLAGAVASTNPLWIAEFIGFSRTADVSFVHPVPVARTRETVRLFAEHCAEVTECCGRPVVLENIAAPLDVGGDMQEIEFLNLLSEESGCGLLIDVASLATHARLHRFDPVDWIDELEPQHIVQLHVGPCLPLDGPRPTQPEATIRDEVWLLAAAVAARAGGNLRAAVIERDTHFPLADELEAELERLARVVAPSLAAPAALPS